MAPSGSRRRRASQPVADVPDARGRAGDRGSEKVPAGGIAEHALDELAGGRDAVGGPDAGDQPQEALPFGVRTAGQAGPFFPEPAGSGSMGDSGGGVGLVLL